MKNTITITDDNTIKTSELMERLRSKFPVSSFWDNDELDKYFLQPKETTTRTFLKTQESKKKKKSFNDLKGQPLMTLREYILFFAAYYKDTGEYPDEEGYTFFGDSLPDGNVAYGDWRRSNSEVRFYWYSPGNRSSSGGARVAISLTPSSLLPLNIEEAIKVVKEAGYQISKII